MPNVSREGWLPVLVIMVAHGCHGWSTVSHCAHDVYFICRENHIHCTCISTLPHGREMSWLSMAKSCQHKVHNHHEDRCELHMVASNVELDCKVNTSVDWIPLVE